MDKEQGPLRSMEHVPDEGSEERPEDQISLTGNVDEGCKTTLQPAGEGDGDNGRTEGTIVISTSSESVDGIEVPENLDDEVVHINISVDTSLGKERPSDYCDRVEEQTDIGHLYGQSSERIEKAEKLDEPISTSELHGEDFNNDKALHSGIGNEESATCGETEDQVDLKDNPVDAQNLSDDTVTAAREQSSHAAVSDAKENQEAESLSQVSGMTVDVSKSSEIQDIEYSEGSAQLKQIVSSEETTPACSIDQRHVQYDSISTNTGTSEASDERKNRLIIEQSMEVLEKNPDTPSSSQRASLNVISAEQLLVNPDSGIDTQTSSNLHKECEETSISESGAASSTHHETVLTLSEKGVSQNIVPCDQDSGQSKSGGSEPVQQMETEEVVSSSVPEQQMDIFEKEEQSICTTSFVSPGVCSEHRDTYIMQAVEKDSGEIAQVFQSTDSGNSNIPDIRRDTSVAGASNTSENEVESMECSVSSVEISTKSDHVVDVVPGEVLVRAESEEVQGMEQVDVTMQEECADDEKQTGTPVEQLTESKSDNDAADNEQEKGALSRQLPESTCSENKELMDVAEPVEQLDKQAISMSSITATSVADIEMSCDTERSSSGGLDQSSSSKDDAGDKSKVHQPADENIVSSVEERESDLRGSLATKECTRLQKETVICDMEMTEQASLSVSESSETSTEDQKGSCEKRVAKHDLRDEDVLPVETVVEQRRVSYETEMPGEESQNSPNHKSNVSSSEPRLATQRSGIIDRYKDDSIQTSKEDIEFQETMRETSKQPMKSADVCDKEKVGSPKPTEECTSAPYKAIHDSHDIDEYSLESKTNLTGYNEQVSEITESARHTEQAQFSSGNQAIETKALESHSPNMPSTGPCQSSSQLELTSSILTEISGSKDEFDVQDLSQPENSSDVISMQIEKTHDETAKSLEEISQVSSIMPPEGPTESQEVIAQDTSVSGDETAVKHGVVLTSLTSEKETLVDKPQGEEAYIEEPQSTENRSDCAHAEAERGIRRRQPNKYLANPSISEPGHTDSADTSIGACRIDDQQELDAMPICNKEEDKHSTGREEKARLVESEHVTTSNTKLGTSSIETPEKARLVEGLNIISSDDKHDTNRTLSMGDQETESAAESGMDISSENKLNTDGTSSMETQDKEIVVDSGKDMTSRDMIQTDGTSSMEVQEKERVEKSENILTSDDKLDADKTFCTETLEKVKVSESVKAETSGDTLQTDETFSMEIKDKEKVVESGSVLTSNGTSDDETQETESVAESGQYMSSGNMLQTDGTSSMEIQETDKFVDSGSVLMSDCKPDTVGTSAMESQEKVRVAESVNIVTTGETIQTDGTSSMESQEKESVVESGSVLTSDDIPYTECTSAMETQEKKRIAVSEIEMVSVDMLQTDESSSMEIQGKENVLESENVVTSDGASAMETQEIERVAESGQDMTSGDMLETDGTSSMEIQEKDKGVKSTDVLTSDDPLVTDGAFAMEAQEKETDAESVNNVTSIETPEKERVTRSVNVVTSSDTFFMDGTSSSPQNMEIGSSSEGMVSSTNEADHDAKKLTSDEPVSREFQDGPGMTDIDDSNKISIPEVEEEVAGTEENTCDVSVEATDSVTSNETMRSVEVTEDIFSTPNNSSKTRTDDGVNRKEDHVTETKEIQASTNVLEAVEEQVTEASMVSSSREEPENTCDEDIQIKADIKEMTAQHDTTCDSSKAFSDQRVPSEPVKEMSEDTALGQETDKHKEDKENDEIELDVEGETSVAMHTSDQVEAEESVRETHTKVAGSEELTSTSAVSNKNETVVTEHIEDILMLGDSSKHDNVEKVSTELVKETAEDTTLRQEMDEHKGDEANDETELGAEVDSPVAMHTDNQVEAERSVTDTPSKAIAAEEVKKILSVSSANERSVQEEHEGDIELMNSDVSDMGDIVDKSSAGNDSTSETIPGINVSEGTEEASKSIDHSSEMVITDESLEVGNEATSIPRTSSSDAAEKDSEQQSSMQATVSEAPKNTSVDFEADTAELMIIDDTVEVDNKSESRDKIEIAEICDEDTPNSSDDLTEDKALDTPNNTDNAAILHTDMPIVSLAMESVPTEIMGKGEAEKDLDIMMDSVREPSQEIDCAKDICTSPDKSPATKETEETTEEGREVPVNLQVSAAVTADEATLTVETSETSRTEMPSRIREEQVDSAKPAEPLSMEAGGDAEGMSNIEGNKVSTSSSVEDVVQESRVPEEQNESIVLIEERVQVVRKEMQEVSKIMAEVSGQLAQKIAAEDIDLPENFRYEKEDLEQRSETNKDAGELYVDKEMPEMSRTTSQEIAEAEGNRESVMSVDQGNASSTDDIESESRKSGGAEQIHADLHTAGSSVAPSTEQDGDDSSFGEGDGNLMIDENVVEEQPDSGEVAKDMQKSQAEQPAAPSDNEPLSDPLISQEAVTSMSQESKDSVTPKPDDDQKKAVTVKSSDAQVAARSQNKVPEQASETCQPADEETANMILREILKMSETIGEGVVAIPVTTPEGEVLKVPLTIEQGGESSASIAAVGVIEKAEDNVVQVISDGEEGTTESTVGQDVNGSDVQNDDATDHHLQNQDNFDEAEVIAIEAESGEASSNSEARKAKKRIFSKTCRTGNCSCKFCLDAKRAKQAPVETDVGDSRTRRKTMPATKFKKLSISFTPTVEKVKCSACILEFDDAEKMQAHFDSTHVNQLHVCSMCQEPFQNEELLQLHERSHERSGSFVCLVCDKSYKRKMDIKRHCKVHKDKVPSPVKRKSTSESVSNDNQAKQEPLAPRKVKKLSISFTGTVEKVKCSVCSEEFEGEANMQAHLNSVHSKAPVLCSICQESFQHEESLKQHEASHRRDGRFLCLVCDKSYKRRTDIVNHYNVHKERKPGESTSQPDQKSASSVSRVQPTVKQKPVKPKSELFVCDLCGKEFVQENLLEVHRRIHTGDMPFPCTMCDKAFKQANLLKKHERVHTGEKPFQCQYCNKRFYSGSNRRRHERTHTGYKPYVCRVCDKPLSEKWILKKHEKSHLSIGGISFDD